MHSGADLYGASRCLLRLGSRLVRDGHVVMAVLPYDGPLRRELEQSGVAVVIHSNLAVVVRNSYRSLKGKLSLLRRVPASVVSLVALARRFRPDVLHTNTSLILSPGLVAALGGIPHVWHVREFFFEFPRLWRFYQWLMYAFSDQIVSVSQTVADQYHPRIAARKVVVVLDGFPREEFAEVPAERVAAFRRTFGLDGKLCVGVVGRIKIRRKGQDVFLKACALLKDRFPQAVFLLIGSPFPGNEAHLNAIRQLAKDLGIENRVIYTGDVDDIKAAYAALDVSVLPSSLPEPMGGVVAESMAFGKAFVGTRSGGTPELVADGVSGLLVDPDNPQQLAEALERLLRDARLRADFGAEARRRFLAKFEFEDYYAKVMGVYVGLTASKRTI